MLDRWITDTEQLISALPQDSLISSRADYLLDKLLGGCVEVDASVFSAPSFDTPKGTALLVTRKDLLAEEPSKLGELARRLPGNAFIAHGTGVPSVIALLEHDPGAPNGNGHVLLHEIEHFTELENGLIISSDTLGARERRAYQINTRIMEALDGGDFDRYVDAWPVDFTASSEENSIAAEIRFHDEACPEPPKDTFTHELWREGLKSQQLLQSTGRMAVLEHVAIGLPEALIDQLAGGLQLKG